MKRERREHGTLHGMNEPRFHQHQNGDGPIYRVLLVVAGLMWAGILLLAIANPPLLSCEAQNPGHVHVRAK